MQKRTCSKVIQNELSVKWHKFSWTKFEYGYRTSTEPLKDPNKKTK